MIIQKPKVSASGFVIYQSALPFSLDPSGFGGDAERSYLTLRKKVVDSTAEKLGQRGKHEDIGGGASRFPFGNGLEGHVQMSRYLLLRQPAGSAQSLEIFRKHNGFHAHRAPFPSRLAVPLKTSFFYL